MALKDVLVEALRAVEEAEIPAELREIAFAKAIDLAAGPAPRARRQPTGTEGATEEEEDEGDKGSGGPIQRIAAKLKLDREVVSHVYYVNADGNLEIVLSASKLASKVGPAEKELALLTAAGRQAAGIDTDFTPAEEIRAVCEHFKKYDGSNFAAYLQQMDDVFNFRGTPRKREVRMTMPAWDQASALVKRLASSG